MSDFEACFKNNRYIMMEGALAERLKNEFNLVFDENVFLGSLIYDEKSKAALSTLWKQYYDVASRYNVPFMATTPTRRINSDRVLLSGFNADIIKDNIDFLKEIKKTSGNNMYVGYMLGCRGDAYTGNGCCSVEDSYSFHKWKIDLAEAQNPDFIYAALIPSCDEALGIAKRLGEHDVPYIISFTIKEDGCLVDGTPITEAIKRIDSSVEKKALCYMTNCVHPRIIFNSLKKNEIEVIKNRFNGIQVNTADYPYAVLESSLKLVNSNPEELAKAVKKLDDSFFIKIFGGCCGTNDLYMDRIMNILSL